MTERLKELNKLEDYLKEHEIQYERIDKEDSPYGYDRHQISVPTHTKKEWDAICQRGSYGYEDGLLEIYGSLVDRAKYGDTDSVVGCLTAEDVIRRIEGVKVNIFLVSRK